LIDELEACFVVIDSAGQKLAYVYVAGFVGAPKQLSGPKKQDFMAPIKR
jgi:hypothetical protein